MRPDRPDEHYPPTNGNAGGKLPTGKEAWRFPAPARERIEDQGLPTGVLETAEVFPAAAGGVLLLPTLLRLAA
jgi:hypothetical protein